MAGTPMESPTNLAGMICLNSCATPQMIMSPQCHPVISRKGPPISAQGHQNGSRAPNTGKKSSTAIRNAIRKEYSTCRMRRPIEQNEINHDLNPKLRHEIAAHRSGQPRGHNPEFFSDALRHVPAKKGIHILPLRHKEIGRQQAQ